MRFDLTLRPTRPRQRLLFNYQYPLQGWLYGLLHRADADYAAFLHERGYAPPDSRKHFKHFTFSSLRIPRTDKIRPGDTYMTLRSDFIYLTVSFYLEQAAGDFVAGLFQNQQLSLYNRDLRADFVVERVETLPSPDFTDCAVFKTLSPLVVAEKVNGIDQYLPPTDPLFGRCLALNLYDKYRSLSDQPLPQLDGAAAEKLIRFRLLSDPERIKKRGFLAKEGKADVQTKVIGYHNFEFELMAPPEILEVGYFSGLGRFNAMGCGCVGIVEFFQKKVQIPSVPCIEQPPHEASLRN